MLENFGDDREKENSAIILHNISLSFLENGYNIREFPVPWKNAEPQGFVICDNGQGRWDLVTSFLQQTHWNSIGSNPVYVKLFEDLLLINFDMGCEGVKGERCDKVWIFEGVVKTDTK